MKLLKPPWVNHNDKPIFSIDVHPDGTRFATAGQGDSSGRITIWSVLPLTSVENEKNINLPKMLCQMDNHFACVNCVRWSNSGTWLASAGDDKLVMIWRYGGGVSKVFGSSQDNVESWRCIHTLRGHSGDVLDVSWSPQDKYLATCSVDNTVVVWNAFKFPVKRFHDILNGRAHGFCSKGCVFKSKDVCILVIPEVYEQLHILKGHTGMVKGVTWDPIGKYLATQSDDKTLIVWRTSDWQQEKVITEPFIEANGTTHVLRLGWSPDGTYLVSAHAMNNMGPTAQIISRDGWNTGMDFVGHRKAVSCVRFNPKLLRRPVKSKKKTNEEWVKYCCCAVGSRDSSCSIWLTALRRPLVVLHDLFTNSVIDLAWNGRGTQLFLCSSDGTVAFVEFSEEEIGSAISEEEKTKVLCSRYGESTVLNGAAPAQIIENAELLKLHRQSMSNISNGNIEMTKSCVTLPPPTNATNKSNVNQMHTPDKNSARSSNVNTPSKQIETRTRDGRRRITPIFLSPPPAVADIAPPIFTSLSTNEISKIVVEHASSEDASLFTIPQLSSSKSPIVTANAGGNKDSVVGDDNAMAVIKPMSHTEAKSTSSPVKNKHSSSEQTKLTKQKTILSPNHKASLTEASKEIVNEIAVKRKAPPQANRKKKEVDTVSGPLAGAHVATCQQQQPLLQPSTQQQVKSCLKLPVANLKKTFTHQVTDGDKWSVDITITNSVISTGSGSVSSIRCVSQCMTWSAMFNRQIRLVQANRYLVCVACEHHILSLFDANGQRFLPDIQLDSDVSYLCVNRYHCMVVTSRCLLSLWDLESVVCTVKAIDFSYLVNTESSSGGRAVQQLAVSKCFLTEQNMPCVVLSDLTSYIYHLDAQAWLLISQTNDSVKLYSSKQLVCDTSSTTSTTSGPVMALSTELNSFNITAHSMPKADAGVHDRCTFTHIQQQMALCRALNSPSEFRTWLMAYVRYLAKNDKELMLRELCSQCTQSVYKSMKRQLPSTSQLQLMNLDRVELLRDILPIIGFNLKLQRLYTEYSDLLDAMELDAG